jgi:drug/metabolite transporter (DMT)-like permease
MRDHRRMPPLHVLAGYALLVLIWGSTWAAIKIGVTDVPPFMFAFERGVAVSVLLTALALVLGQRFPRGPRELAAAAVVGIFNTGTSWAIIFWSEQFVPSGIVAVFGATAPVWTAFLAHFLVRGDRLSALKLVGLALGLIGTALLVGAPGTGSGSQAFIATGLLAFMPITWAFAAILQSRVLARTPPIAAVAAGTWAGTVVLVPFALAQIGLPASWTLASALAFAYLVGFGSCVGLVLNMWLYRKLRPTTIMLAQVLIPAQAILIGTLALAEPVSARMLGGAALVVAAVALNALAGGGEPTGERAEARAAAAK